MPLVCVCVCERREHAGVHRQVAYRVNYNDSGEIVMADILYSQQEQQPMPAISEPSISETNSSDDDDECCSSCCCKCCRRCCTRHCCWKACKITLYVLAVLLFSVLFLAAVLCYLQASANSEGEQPSQRRR